MSRVPRKGEMCTPPGKNVSAAGNIIKDAPNAQGVSAVHRPEERKKRYSFFKKKHLDLVIE